MNSDIAIKVEHLSKLYSLHHPLKDEQGNDTHELWALKDVSFEIKKGESVGIIGPNGSGKSTLLKILAGVTKPTSGKVEINGRIASILDIGAGFHPELSGRENIFLNGQIHGFSKKEIRLKFDEIVAFSGIEKFIDEPVKNYSNGMYLRLAFSIMAHLDFDMYLFDEVFSVGDTKFAAKVNEKIDKIINSKKTIIHVSHNFNEFHNKVLYILVEAGEVKELSRNRMIISNYVERNLNLKKNEILTNAIEIEDFSTFPESDELKIIKVKFYQNQKDDKEQFITNKSFIIELEYEKFKDENTIDIILIVSDYQGNPIITSTSFIAGDFSKWIKRGRYVNQCIIPSNTFHSQPYKISFYFVKNTERLVLQSIHNENVKNLYNDNTIDIALKISDLILFKPLFFKNGMPADLGSLNLGGQILLGCDWKSESIV